MQLLGGQSDGNTPARRADRFLAGRGAGGGVSAARAMGEARAQHAAMLDRQRAAAKARTGISPRTSALSAAWQPVGPGQVASLNYGNVTGRVTSVSIDPADPAGNTIYLEPVMNFG